MTTSDPYYSRDWAYTIDVSTPTIVGVGSEGEQHNTENP